MPGPLLTIRDAAVRYGETPALAGVSLAIDPGSVHALIGENGAGKSTLMRAIASMTRLNAGSIQHARPLRIEWVPQELAMAADLTVTETIFLGRERCTAWRTLRRGLMQREAAAALARLDCAADPLARIGTLSAPVRKQVQLARAFHTAADVLLLDEPTAVLGRAATERLFAAIRSARAQGTAIVYVSHQIDEVLAISDTVTVLRDGTRISTDPVSATDATTIVTRMVGRVLTDPPARRHQPGAPRLHVRDLSSARLRNISFTVAAGEVVGLAGLVGAGRSEVLEIIAGLHRPTSGVATVEGVVAFVPEDRLKNGLVPTLTLRENIFLPAPTARLHRGEERIETGNWIDRLHIRASGAQALPDTLSGGNQQKVLLARALRAAPDVLLLDEPTAGVDVGAKADIHRIIRERSAAGAAVVIASSDLPELFALADRIVALREGAHAGTVSAADATEARVAALITGAA